MGDINIWVTLLTAIGGAIVGSAATIVTGAFGYLNTNRGQDIQMVNIALSILGGDNKDTSVPGRKFALRALREYTQVNIPDDEFEQWALSGTLPEEVFRPQLLPHVFRFGSIYGADETLEQERSDKLFREVLEREIEQRSRDKPKTPTEN